jgi:hypothetical protein
LQRNNELGVPNISGTPSFIALQLGPKKISGTRSSLLCCGWTYIVDGRFPQHNNEFGVPEIFFGPNCNAIMSLAFLILQ